MSIFRLKQHRHFSIIFFLLFRWQQRIHVYLFFIILFIASLISYRQPFGLLHNIKYVIFEYGSIQTVQNNLINEHKQQQKIAYEWLDNLLQNPKTYPHLFSNHSEHLHSFDYLHVRNNHSYRLLNRPKQLLGLNTTDHIAISILYGKQDTNHREGKFYIGQMLYHLLRNYHQRFLITLCENNNTNEEVSDGIRLIRQLLPVFIVDSVSTTIVNTYEREKQAHVQCILANFQSLPNVNYLLLLQDDAEPVSEHFYQQFSSLIDSRIQQQWPVNSHRQQPGFIKIYHPRWLVSYLYPSIYLVTQLFATSLLLTCLCFYVIHHKTNSMKQFEQYHYSRLSFNNQIFLPAIISRNLIYFLFYFVLMTLVVLLLDHSNISWTWRSFHPTFYAIYPAPSCCLPGVIYFRQTYVEVLEYLNRIECHSKYAIDTAFDDLPRRTGLRTFLVEPNLVHHIGLYSRLRRTYINPYLLD